LTRGRTVSISSCAVVLLSRYIGNKTDLLGSITDVIGRHAAPGDLVCDIFSGTLAVSIALKRQGYRVASNDVNLFSAVYGRAYLTNGAVPDVDLTQLLGKRLQPDLTREATQIVESLRGTEGYCFLSNPERRLAFGGLVALLRYLETMTADDLPLSERQTFMFDIYCADGGRSSFVSSRGSTGRRNFFAAPNAKRIDLILSQLRRWYQSNLLSESLLAVLLATLLTAVAKVSNTQGTYHDFPRHEQDPRALLPLVLVPPAFDGLLGASDGHLLGVERDSLDFINEVPHHRVIYIDPPYNFRQYTAYYFMLNVLARYVEIEDLDEYFAAIRYVRGQNPADDFTSTFSSRRLFLQSLNDLITRAKADWVVLSYFNGRNHFGEFKTDAGGPGYAKMESLFDSGLFRSGSQEVVPILRTNYQSYGGYRAKPIEEHIFIAEKAQ